MPLQINQFRQNVFNQSGVSLVELVVFIVVVSIALLALLGVYNQATIHNVDPLVRVRALESAQSKLDEILLLKYDENTPTGVFQLVIAVRQIQWLVIILPMAI